MAKQAPYVLRWSASQHCYELLETDHQTLLDRDVERHDWAAWARQATSFTFQGRKGSFTARQEQRKRGGGYWYAYAHLRGKLNKRYLGSSSQLAIARLEDIADRMGGAGNSKTLRDAAKPGGQEKTKNPVQAQRPPLLVTKLHPPRLRSAYVHRDHLVEQLQRGVEGTCTLLSAPAGFGKTSLLAEWLTSCGLPVAWLSLEPGDNDLGRFLTYLVAAVQTLDAALGQATLDLLQVPQPPNVEALLSVLINDLTQSNMPRITLVLDDFHVIEAQPIHKALRFLLEHIPPQFHLVIASRGDPPFPLARLRARGQISELRASDLRFDQKEAQEFFQSVMQLDLTSEEVTQVERCTEGWIAGMQFAALSLRGKTDIPAYLAAFSGSHRMVLEYLSEEVFLQQPGQVQSFLLQTCILDQLSTPLCDAVTDQQDSQNMLEQLERANVFVVSLDDERRWFRYHHLFAEMLRSRLRQTQPTQVAGLHERASKWYEREGFLSEAVEHALAAQDEERAALLIERRGWTFALQGQVQTVLGWLKRLSRALVQENPRLSILLAGLLLFNNQLHESSSQLLNAERAIQSRPSSEETRGLMGHIVLTRGNIALAIGDVQQSLSLFQDALDLVPEAESSSRLGAHAGLACGYLVNGDVTPAAEAQLADIVGLAETADPFTALSSISLLAYMRVLQGHLHQAVMTYERAMDTAGGRERLSHLVGSSPYYIGLGVVLREWNRLDDAAQYLAQGMELIKRNASVYADVVAGGAFALARLELARGNTRGSFVALQSFRDLALQRHFVPRLLDQAAAIEAELALVQGNLTTAARWAEGSGVHAADEELDYLREREYLSLARVRLAEAQAAGQKTPRDQVLQLLARLLGAAERSARGSSVIEILLLQALTWHIQGDIQKALNTLRRALELAEPEGYVRLFIDEGPPLVALLRLAHSRGIALHYTARLLEAAYAEPLTARGQVLALAELPTQRSTKFVDSLTEREREILGLLATGATNEEIAAQLVIAISTAKRHVSNILAKLSVSNRSQAVARSRALGLL
jgi:LuxR family maltose regulon positive regulatory protein